MTTETTDEAVYANLEWLQAKEVFFIVNRPSTLDAVLQRRRWFPHVLDCGSGIGSLIKHVAPLIEYDTIVGVELNPKLANIATRLHTENTKARFLVGNIEHLPAELESNSFDLVMNQEVLEHVHDKSAAVKEMARVLKPGGTLMCLRNYDSDVYFWPDSSQGREVDQVMIRNVNQGVVAGPGGDDRCGRKLQELAVDAGLTDIAVSCTPWFLYPNPVLSPAEQYVLLKIVGIFHDANVGHLDQHVLDAWLTERTAQIDSGQLTFFMNYFSLSATKPA